MKNLLLLCLIAFTTSSISYAQTTCYGSGNDSLTIDAYVISYVTCNGYCDGYATVQVNAGSGNYSYQWNDPATTTTPTIGNLCAGTYTVMVCDNVTGICCSESVYLFEPPALYSSVSVTAQDTGGTCTGEMVGMVTGGVTPYTFNWTDCSGSSINNYTSTLSNACAGCYCFQVIDGNGCFASSCDTVGSVNCSYSVTATVMDVTCNGMCDGTISLSTDASNPTILWSTGQTGPTATGLCAGQVCATITDDNGCQKDTCFTINEPPAISMFVNTTPENCYGYCDGTLDIIATGGNPPYQYSIDCGMTFTSQQTYNNLCPGTYCCVVEDLYGCQQIYTAVVGQATEIIIDTITTTNETSPGANDGSLTFGNVTGGTPPYTYSIDGGSTYSGSTSFTGLAPGTYYPCVMDANGCSTCYDTVYVNSPCGYDVVETIQEPLCNGSCGGYIILSTNASNPTYQWDNGQTTASITALCAGTYCVTVTDDNGCQWDTCYTLTEPSPLNVTSSEMGATCNGACDGYSIIFASGGTPPYTVDIGSGPQPFTSAYTYPNLCAGTYIAQVIDNNGCQYNHTFVITEPPVLQASASVTQQGTGNCDGELTGTASGGTAPYTYEWYDCSTGSYLGGGTTLNNACPGDYYFQVWDNNGCVDTTSCMNISGTACNYTVVETIQGPTCNGNCNGYIILSTDASNPTYQWDNGQTTASITALCAGTYCVTVTDDNGCQWDTCYTLSEPPPLAVTSSELGVSCNGLCDGSSTIFATGGTPPYTVDIGLGPQSFTSSYTILNLCPGSYVSQVIDANGCGYFSHTFVITEPTPLNVSIDSVVNTTGSDGEIYLSASGGTPAYQYSVDGGSTWSSSGSFTNLTSGSYTVCVQDMNGCIDCDTAVVDSATSIGESVLEDVVLYPNPATDIVTLSLPDNTNDAQLMVYDLRSRLIYSEYLIGGGDIRLDVNRISGERGVYLVKVVIEDNEKVFRLVVQ